MPNSSEITTTPKAQGSAIGTQLGGRGLAMPANSTPQERLAALEQAVERLRLSLRSPLVMRQDRDDMEAMVAPLSVPAKPEWIAARVASLLSTY